MVKYSRHMHGMSRSGGSAVAPCRSARWRQIWSCMPSAQARTYKKELIVFLMAGTGVADMGLNFVFNLRDLGYDHWWVACGMHEH